MKIDPMKAIALILIGAFVIDRIVDIRRKRVIECGHIKVSYAQEAIQAGRGRQKHDLRHRQNPLP